MEEPRARRRILVLFAHPALQKSRVNRRLIEAIGGLDGVTLHDLYQSYPDFDIDVEAEQRLLLEHDVIVLQHPLYWYSTPAILKEWQDLVLEHGWAYGREGTALGGKRALSVITAGGSEATYCGQGRNRFSIRQFLLPLEATFRLCGVEYLPPWVVFGTHAMTQQEIERHAADYRRTLEALRDRRLDLERARGRTRLNGRLDELIGTAG